VERRLGEPATGAAHRERLAEHRKVLVTVVDQAAGQVTPVDQQLGQPHALGVQVGADLVGHLGLGEVRWGDPDGADQVGVQAGEHVPLVAVHPATLGLAAVAHLRILHRDPPVARHAPADAGDVVLANDGVLVANCRAAWSPSATRGSLPPSSSAASRSTRSSACGCQKVGRGC
jgi:hypothetical protein